MGRESYDREAKEIIDSVSVNGVIRLPWNKSSLQIRITEALHRREVEAREKIAMFMLKNCLATGHGDTIDDLLKELVWQVDKMVDAAFNQGLEEAAKEVEEYKTNPPPMFKTYDCLILKQAAKIIRNKLRK